MRTLQSIVVLLLLTIAAHAQVPATTDDVNTQSYALYEKSDWKNLLSYGKKALAEGTDFPLLRLRLGYAAFMIGNYSEAVEQYEAVLTHDSYNSTARYYLWLSRRYLGQRELADVHAKYVSAEAAKASHISPVGFTEAGAEASFKTTPQIGRGNGLYVRADIGTRLGWNIHMVHAGAIYNQTISEGKFLYVTNNDKIQINQKEYYNKTTISFSRNWQIKAAYHYIKTPFNNFSYNNHAGLLGIKYYSSYFDVQGDAIVSRLTDSTGQQYDVQLGLYPNGNLNLYSYSTVTSRNRSGSTAFNFKEVLGFKLIKSLWIEGNGTFGSFSNLFENDVLYVYNAIDRNLLKAGVTAYVVLSPTLLLQLGYTFEQRELYQRTQTFYQHSTTGGLSWKM